MPWKQTCAMNERREFIKDWMSHAWSLSQLCRAYDISRPTAYKWIERFEAQGLEGLVERSRAAVSHPNATKIEVQRAIIAMKQRFIYFGPRKIRKKLIELDADQHWPATSTIGTILKRQGYVISRRKRRRVTLYAKPLCADAVPNDVWAADFKGWFTTADGSRIDPFTVSDIASRYLIRCRSVAKTDGASVKAQLTMAFKEFGMPKALRTDNGSPFATLGLGGLSKLSVWLIKLGIAPERIRPAHPQENGVHERMHRTLKHETARPPQANPRAQQESFDAFVRRFNEERPHESLGMRKPTDVYQPSPRRFPGRLPDIDYPTTAKVRTVTTNGHIGWKDGRIYLTHALEGERVGIVQVDEDSWEIRFANVVLGKLDERKMEVTRL